MNRLAWALAIATGIGAGWWWLALDGRLVAGADFDLDPVQLRARAGPVAQGPSELHVEHVASYEFAAAMVAAGEPWRGTPIPIYSYRLVYPERTILIDAAFDRALAVPQSMVPMFDDAAAARVTAALERAALIVVTHEHPDHIGGIARHPRLASLLPALRLTRAQLADPERLQGARFADDALAGYRPLHYTGLHALAPGVVLIGSPGHTPGSQMVYVRRADGRELLFVGDVVWQARNIRLRRERPRFMTLMIGEDRAQVSAQIRALVRLQQAAPEISIVPGHDGAVVDALIGERLLARGFGA